MLAEHVLGWDTARVLTDGHEAAPRAFLDRYEALVARRLAREPLAYLTGVKEFWGLAFIVSPAVLIPRPETEGLVEHTLKRVPDRTSPLRIADVCTGSGCVGIALAKEYPHSRITATDSSPAAVEIAARNARELGVADRFSAGQDDLLTHAPGPFDVIVANPPYVSENDRRDLQPEVRREPAQALFAGTDGLDIIRRLVVQAADRLAVDGLLLFEFGAGQAGAIKKLILRTGALRIAAIEPDFSGIPRIAIATDGGRDRL